MSFSAVLEDDDQTLINVNIVDKEKVRLHGEQINLCQVPVCHSDKLH